MKLCSPTVLLPFLVATLASAANITVFENAKIFKVTDGTEDQWAEAVAFDTDTGLIVAVGTLDQVLAIVDPSDDDEEEPPNPCSVVTPKEASSPANVVTMVDLNGRMVLPGFHDVHIHAAEAGIFESLCGIDEYAPPREWRFYLNGCFNNGRFGDQGWIVGIGVDIGSLMEDLWYNPYQDYPITVLDRAYPNTPVLILDSLGHGAIANSKAMQIVGYDRMRGNPPGGKIDRDAWSGELTGIVLENAQHLLRNAAFPPTQANQNLAYDGLLGALDAMAQQGITIVSDAGGFWQQAQTESWRQVEDAGLMTVRASNALYIYPHESIENMLPDLMARYTNDPNKLTNLNQAKIYVDGILDLASAALNEPYAAFADLPPDDELGFEYFGNAATLNNVARTLAQNGFQLFFHVVGDRAARLALDAIEAAGPLADGRPHRLTHSYMITPEDQDRIVAMGVNADFQWAPSTWTDEYLNFMQDWIGRDRTAKLQPAKEVFNKGGLVTMSSDWDADDLSPLVKLQVLTTSTQWRSGFDSLETAIRFMTINGAKVLNTNTGSIQVGNKADFAIINNNLFDVAPANISKQRVDMTVLDGTVVFDPNGVAGNAVGRFPAPSILNESSGGRKLFSGVGLAGLAGLLA